MKNSLNTFILGVTIIVAVLILARTYQHRNKSDNIISVKGLGEKDFVSDLIVWSAHFNKKSMELSDAFELLKTDREAIRTYLTGKGVNPDEIVFSSVDISNEFDYYYDNHDNRHSTFTGYRLSQDLQIESNEVDKIEQISREVTELINQGITLESYAPQYYYTKLSELKIEMIAAATQDATLRAEKIAENADADLGSLRKGSMGIFQIIAQNSNEDYSWGGTFNTSSKRKTATITMQLTFAID